LNPAICVVMFALGVPLGFLGFAGVALISGLLILVFQIPVHLAYGTALGSVFATVVLGGWSHYREGNVDRLVATEIALIGTLGAYAGGTLALATSASLLKLLTGAVLLLNALVMYLQLRDPRFHKMESGIAPSSRDPWRESPGYLGIGIVTGFMSGFLGIGAVPWVQTGLLMLKRIDLNKVIGTALFGVILTSLSGAIRFAQGGQLDIGILASVVLGMSSGSYLGAKLTNRAPIWLVHAGMVATPLIGAIMLIVAPVPE